MLFSLAVIFVAGVILSKIFQKLNFPGSLGMMLAGIIVGPYLLNLINDKALNL